jgi:hypothetical protein
VNLAGDLDKAGPSGLATVGLVGDEHHYQNINFNPAGSVTIPSLRI